jgi:succinate dehydrogenase / fumarate reductase flavoprotein subunit
VSGDAPEQAHVDVESLRNDGRIWVPKKKEDAKAIQRGQEERQRHRRGRSRLLPGAPLSGFGNLVPRDVASRAAKERCDAGFGVNKTGEAVYLDFASPLNATVKLEANVKRNIETLPRKRS